jgi:hypothetical protein
MSSCKDLNRLTLNLGAREFRRENEISFVRNKKTIVTTMFLIAIFAASLVMTALPGTGQTTRT